VTGRIFLKLIGGLLCMLLLALATVDYYATKVAQDTYKQNLLQQVADKCRMLGLILTNHESIDAAPVRAMAQRVGGRITVVRSDGKVLVDSDAVAAEMENHRSRPELMRALRDETGWDERRSATLGVPFLYVAVPWSGDAIRIAVPLSRIGEQVNQIRRKILVSTALAFLPAFLIAALAARYISRRFGAIMSHASQLAGGNFRARLPHNDTSEFGQLAQTLNETAENLQQTVEQLQHEQAELEKLERVRKDFVINVSHELRTPLASIQGYTETLMDGALTDADHNMRFLGIIRHNAERLARITEDLLTLSRIEQKRQKFEFDYHPVNALLRDAFDVMRPIAEKSGLRLEVEAAQASATVVCDREAVSQILSNLLDNAIKYTPAGGRVTLGAQIAGEFAEIFVRDTGIGIPAEELPRLFERFYRVDKARSRELGGTGLGLSIVKHLVAAQNGAARVESRVGEGSTFYFTIPLEEMAPGKDQLNPEFTTS
jgi:two-component system phosphate regulon sensor histidine kinase PhoR